MPREFVLREQGLWGFVEKGQNEPEHDQSLVEGELGEALKGPEGSQGEPGETHFGSGVGLENASFELGNFGVEHGGEIEPVNVSFGAEQGFEQEFEHRFE